MLKSFASDNTAGAHPRILAALQAANEGYAASYGADLWTEEATSCFQTIFGEESRVFFVGLGTAANVLSLKTLLRPWQSVICSDVAHIQMDEGGAPEAFTGAKLQTVPSTHGIIRIEDIEPLLLAKGNVHQVQPRVISITQATEFGTLYTPNQVRDLASFAHQHDMLLHMDGSRIANAAAALKLDFAAATRDLGVDVLSFGGTKNGLLFGEAVVFFDASLAEEFSFVRKQGMQLFSKMRFISAQFTEYLQNDLWRTNAEHANAMAQLLASGVRDLSYVTITRPVEVNAVFATLSPEHIERLGESFFFQTWDEVEHEVRWMTSFADRKSVV